MTNDPVQRARPGSVRQGTPPLILPAGSRVLGSFTIEKYLGQGSFAHVYLASQDGTRRRAVIKVAHPRLLDHPDKEAYLRTFAVEFEAATAVVHPNVATLYLVGTLPNGLPAIAMEWVPGPTVESLVQKYGHFSAGVTMRMWSQLASALDAIHGQGIVHQDLTPRNVVVTRHPATQHLMFKVLDFGVSHLPHLETVDHRGAGTPAYMAPEQFMRQPVPASDVYALGAMIWWAVTGHELREDLSSEQISRMVVSGTLSAPDPDPLVPHLPVELAMLLVEMLDPDPARRPSARELHQTLPSLWRSASARLAAAGRSTGSDQMRVHSTISLELPALVRTNPLVAAASSAPASASLAPPDTDDWSLPSQPSHLDISLVSHLPPATRRDVIESFIGAMPNLLVGLEEAADGFDIEQAHRLCRDIVRASDGVGATLLSSLVNRYAQMDLPTFIEFRHRELEKINAEYGKVFQTLLARLS